MRGWIVPNMWEGGRCYILGGGPSLPRQFGVPEEIIQKVQKGLLTPAAYSPYMREIHNAQVIAVNSAFKIGTWIDVLFFGDSAFYQRFEKDILEWPGLRVSCAKGLQNQNGRLKLMLRNKSRLYGIEKEPGLLCWNKNSGSAAINLAVQLGCKEIVLLGFDMRLDAAQNQHWHKYYTGDLRVVNKTFAKHLKSFSFIAKELEGKVKIYNACPDSAIREFEKVELQDLLPELKRRFEAGKWAQRRLQYEPNIANPRSFNEKVLHKKLYDRDERLVLTTDKVIVKEWVADLIGKKYIIPTLWKGKTIPSLRNLPDNYIIKPRHMSGKYMIVRGGEVDKKAVIFNCTDWLERLWGQDREEWAYGFVEPGILIEPLLEKDNGQPIQDFKFHMFNGKCGLVYVDTDRETEIKRTCYTVDWNRLDITITGRSQGPDIAQPTLYRKMLKIAEMLSKDFDFVRIDLYCTGSQIYFSEMTHYPASGSGPIEPVEFDYKLGTKWKLAEKNL